MEKTVIISSLLIGLSVLTIIACSLSIFVTLRTKKEAETEILDLTCRDTTDLAEVDKKSFVSFGRAGVDQNYMTIGIIVSNYWVLARADYMRNFHIEFGLNYYDYKICPFALQNVSPMDLTCEITSLFETKYYDDRVTFIKTADLIVRDTESAAICVKYKADIEVNMDVAVLMVETDGTTAFSWQRGKITENRPSTFLIQMQDTLTVIKANALKYGAVITLIDGVQYLIGFIEGYNADDHTIHIAYYMADDFNDLLSDANNKLTGTYFI
ncbi:hypothetical protein SNEBB_000452 [Seison nebaliae]|nr:hypothetical protein SNEBB_000452 [Seison nebaliae]